MSAHSLLGSAYTVSMFQYECSDHAQQLCTLPPQRGSGPRAGGELLACFLDNIQLICDYLKIHF